MNFVSIDDQDYPIGLVSDILVAAGSAALEQNLTKSSAISAFAFFLKSCCPSIPEEYCRVLGYTPTGEPIFTLSLDADEVLSAHSSIVVAFFKRRISRLEKLKGKDASDDKKIVAQIDSIKNSIESIVSGSSRITVEALVQTMDINEKAASSSSTINSSTIIPATNTIDNAATLRQQMKQLEEQIKTIEKTTVDV